jgi:iron complex transport system substrate-binding protein
MKRLLALMWGLLVLSAAIVGCDDPDGSAEAQSSFPLTLQRSDGRLITFTEPPKRIVSLSPGATETLFAIGSADLIVAVDDVVDYPPQALDFEPKIAQRDTERIRDLHPDLVIVPFESPKTLGAVRELDRAGLRVWCCDGTADSIEEGFGEMLVLGDIVGHRAEAEQLVDDLRERVERVTEALDDVTSEDQRSAYWEVCATCAAGSDTIPGDILVKLRLVNVVGPFVGGAGYLDFEWSDVVEADPQMYIIGDEDLGVTTDEIGERTGAQNIAAVRGGQFFAIDRAITNRAGPRNVDALETLAKLIYPDRF